MTLPARNLEVRAADGSSRTRAAPTNGEQDTRIDNPNAYLSKVKWDPACPIRPVEARMNKTYE